MGNAGSNPRSLSRRVEDKVAKHQLTSIEPWQVIYPRTRGPPDNYPMSVHDHCSEAQSRSSACDRSARSVPLPLGAGSAAAHLRWSDEQYCCTENLSRETVCDYGSGTPGASFLNASECRAIGYGGSAHMSSFTVPSRTTYSSLTSSDSIYSTCLTRKTRSMGIPRTGPDNMQESRHAQAIAHTCLQMSSTRRTHASPSDTASSSPVEIEVVPELDERVDACRKSVSIGAPIGLDITIPSSHLSLDFSRGYMPGSLEPDQRDLSLYSGTWLPILQPGSRTSYEAIMTTAAHASHTGLDDQIEDDLDPQGRCKLPSKDFNIHSIMMSELHDHIDEVLRLYDGIIRRPSSSNLSVAPSSMDSSFTETWKSSR